MKFKQSFISFMLTFALSAVYMAWGDKNSLYASVDYNGERLVSLDGNTAGERLPPSNYDFFPQGTDEKMSKERMSYDSKKRAAVTVDLNDSSVIKDIQKQLNSKGYFVGSPDGNLNAETKNALKKYQKSAGLNATGRLNKATLESLDLKAVPYDPEYSVDEVIYSE